MASSASAVRPHPAGLSFLISSGAGGWEQGRGWLERARCREVGKHSPSFHLVLQCDVGPLLLNSKANNRVFLLWLHRDNSPVGPMAASCFSTGLGVGRGEAHQTQGRVGGISHEYFTKFHHHLLFLQKHSRFRSTPGTTHSTVGAPWWGRGLRASVSAHLVPGRTAGQEARGSFVL